MINAYLKNYGIMIITFLITTLIISILNYFNLINQNIINITKLIIPIIIFFIFGIKIGKISKNKGYLEGIKYSTIFLIFFLIITFIFYRKEINFNLIILYSSIIISTMIGAIIGIQEKKQK